MADPKKVAVALNSIKHETKRRWEEIAEEFGVSKNTIAKYAKGQGDPPYSILERLVTVYGYQSSELFGEGEARDGMRADVIRPSRRRGITGVSVVSTSIKDDLPAEAEGTGKEVEGFFRLVPRAEARLSAGDGSLVLSEAFRESYAFRRDWLSKVATSADNVILMSVLGDSMYPTIQEGDMVMVDRGRDYPQSGKVFAFTPGDNIVQIKRLESRGEQIRIISDNSAIYQPFDLDSDQVHIIGQVIWFARQLVTV